MANRKPKPKLSKHLSFVPMAYWASRSNVVATPEAANEIAEYIPVFLMWKQTKP